MSEFRISIPCDLYISVQAESEDEALKEAQQALSDCCNDLLSIVINVGDQEGVVYLPEGDSGEPDMSVMSVEDEYEGEEEEE